MSRRILVTGASGLIGRHVCRQFVERGHEVIGLSQSDAASADLDLHDRVRFDVLDTDGHGALLSRTQPDVVVHLAWHGVDRLIAPENIDHLHAATALVRSCASAGVDRMLTAGTCVEYTLVDSPLHELRTPCRPETPYGAAKLALGTTIDAYTTAGLLSGAHARIFYTFGAGEMPPRLIAYVLTELLAGRRPSVSAGQQRCDYLVLDDVAGAICTIALSDVTGPVNVASGSAIAVRDLVLLAADAAGASAESIDFGAVEQNLKGAPSIEADIGRLRDEVGFSPRFTLEEAMESTARWYRDNNAEG